MDNASDCGRDASATADEGGVSENSGGAGRSQINTKTFANALPLSAAERSPPTKSKSRSKSAIVDAVATRTLAASHRQFVLEDATTSSSCERTEGFTQAPVWLSGISSHTRPAERETQPGQRAAELPGVSRVAARRMLGRARRALGAPKPAPEA